MSQVIPLVTHSRMMRIQSQKSIRFVALDSRSSLPKCQSDWFDHFLLNLQKQVLFPFKDPLKFFDATVKIKTENKMYFIKSVFSARNG